MPAHEGYCFADVARLDDHELEICIRLRSEPVQRILDQAKALRIVRVFKFGRDVPLTDVRRECLRWRHRAVRFDFYTSASGGDGRDERCQLRLLKKRLAAGYYNISRQTCHNVRNDVSNAESDNLCLWVVVIPIPGVLGVAPRAAQVTKTKPNEDARDTSGRAFALNRFEYLRQTRRKPREFQHLCHQRQRGVSQTGIAEAFGAKQATVAAATG